MDKKIIFIIIVAVLLAAVVLGGYLYWINFRNNPKDKILENTAASSNAAEEITNSATKGVLPSLETNPLENKPDINPADKSNPIKNIKTNPF